MHRNDLLELLRRHHSRYMDEAAYIRRAIRHIKENPDVFERSAPVHVTASAWVVSPKRDRVLLMHHRKYGHWFQPGGHADGEPDVITVALKECTEETGIDPADIRLVGTEIFDVDLHDVPTIGEIPAHGHIDIRFLVEIDDTLPVPGNQESHEVKWVPLHEVLHYNNFRSTYRMLEKTRTLRHSDTCAPRRLAC